MLPEKAPIAYLGSNSQADPICQATVLRDASNDVQVVRVGFSLQVVLDTGCGNDPQRLVDWSFRQIIWINHELSDTRVPFYSGHIGYTFRHLEGSTDAVEKV